jgi:predicted nucleic acid-binding protein
MRLLLDTDLIVSYMRGHGPAVEWVHANPTQRVAVPSIVLMEIVQGCRSKAELTKAERAISKIPTAEIGRSDSILARQLHRTLCLSHGISVPDSFIAAMALNRKDTLVTLNEKHFSAIKGLQILRPY